MPNITWQMLANSARVPQPPFDTHAVIEELQRANPRAYALDLYRFVHHHGKQDRTRPFAHTLARRCHQFLKLDILLLSDLGSQRSRAE